MKRLHERCAGLDVHRDTVAACVQVPGHSEVRTFKATTQGLLALLDWRRGYEVTLVGMESTGVYWRPVYYLLEDYRECWLLNAQHLRNVPGRKTDVQDAEWICSLVAHGLVRPCLGMRAPAGSLSTDAPMQAGGHPWRRLAPDWSRFR
jgi:transposase